MKIEQKYRVNGVIYCKDDISEEKMEAFWEKIEEVMNEFEVYKVEGVLNPYNIGVKIQNK